MRKASSDKNAFVLILAGILALCGAGCQGGGTAANSAAPRDDAGGARASDNGDANYWGEDWDAGRTPTAPRASGARRAAPGTTASAARDDSDSKAQPDDELLWTLVLGTYTGDGHAESAHQMIATMTQVAPQVRGASVYTSLKGSMVIHGRYEGRDDPRARADIERLKAIRYDNRAVFPRVILTSLDTRLVRGDLHPHDLLSARKKHSTVDPLYTLDIAVWDDFESGKMSFAQIRRAAEAYAASLRRQGVEAYFYHDELTQRSSVTVGLFDNSAINSTSGLYSSQVNEFVRKFPQRLVNGEPMFELKNRFSKDPGTKPQTPVLVLVPMM